MTRAHVLELFLTAVIFWTALAAVLLTIGILVLRFDDRIESFIDAMLGGDRHLQADRDEHFAEVRAIGGGHRHLRVVREIGDDVDRDVFPAGDAA